jgi:molybdate transport system substrate-binding protein
MNALRIGLAFVLFLMAGIAGAAEIRVMSSNAMREVLREIAPQFEKASGHKLAMTFLGSADILKRMRAGEGGVEMVVLQVSSIDELIAEGKVVPGSRVDFARSLVGAAVRAGAPKPDIGSGEALKRTLLASKSIVVSSGPSGIYMLGLFERMGIPKEKYRQAAPGVQTGELVARGEAELCFQQVSELLPVKGIEFLGPLSADVGHVTVFAGGIHAAAAQPQAARALMQYLASPAAAPVLRAKGMEPAAR